MIQMLCRQWQTLVPARPGVTIEDMSMFERCCVLYERNQGRPAISILVVCLETTTIVAWWPRVECPFPSGFAVYVTYVGCYSSPEAWTR